MRIRVTIKDGFRFTVEATRDELYRLVKFILQMAAIAWFVLTQPIHDDSHPGWFVVYAENTDFGLNIVSDHKGVYIRQSWLDA